MSRIGYARVSTADQDPTLQTSALDKAGCERVFTDHASGARADRPELAAALDYCRRGDALVVWKLDRLGRSLSHLVDVLNGMRARGIEFVSLTEGMDTSTPMGELLFHIMGALAQFERALIIERTAAGLAVARAAGRTGGRPRALDQKGQQAARTLHASRTPVSEIARVLSVSESTVYRVLSASTSP